MGLNENQKRAVEYLEGPLLVLAGPGTGKTQLLSEKVAYILKNTDTAPENILCLTFTDSGASNMRERMKTLVGREALKVHVSTYHAFGQEIIAQYKNYSPEYLRQTEAAIDEVGQYKLVARLQDELPARDILHGDQVKKIIGSIGEAKAAGLTPEVLKKIAEQNMADSKVLSEAISPLLKNVVPRKFEPSMENAYTPIFEILKNYEDLPPILKNVERSIVSLAREMEAAYHEAEATGKIPPLTSWRNAHFELDDKGRYRLKDRVSNLKLKSLSVVMERYEEYLKENGLFDFNDMIIEAVRVLTEDKGFRDTLQEKYQFVMLDEFQDTNPMQFNIVKRLTDYEKPMIMAVGDDDQAIFEFQGAMATNLADFQRHYAAEVVALTENYRSTQEILDFSKCIIDQAPDRFVNEKPLTAHLPTPGKTQIFRTEFLSSDQEYQFIADEVARLVASGVKQSEIAIITAKHKYFLPLLPFLKSHREIKIAYEKRDNLFEDEKIHQILTILRLAQEVSTEMKPTVSMLEVLSYPWFNISPLSIIKLTAEARDAHRSMFDYLLNLESASAEIMEAMEFLSELSTLAPTTPLETMISKISAKMHPERMEPFEMFRFYENIASLRAKLTRHVGEKPLRTADLIQMVDDYAEAGMPLIVSSPYRDADEAVQVLSAHKAKGLEFEYVFILAADHRAWGKGEGNNNTLTLPSNLVQISHSGITSGEQIRLLYVALTRAKHTLYITNSLHDFAGKSAERLEYFEEREEKTEAGRVVVSPFLPAKLVNLCYTEEDFLKLQSAEVFSAKQGPSERMINLLKPFVKAEPDMRSIYRERVKDYRMSASSLTDFVDIIYAGPEEFFKHRILRAEDQTESEQLTLGNLTHATFELVTNSGVSDEAAVDFFLSELDKQDISLELKTKIREYGPGNIALALKEFAPILREGKAEVNLAHEHLVINGVPVTGKIDHILINEEAKTIEVFDFKTANYHKEGWGSLPALFKYRLQLGFYKLLLNHSPTYSKYRVEKAHILFVKPDADGEVHDKAYEYNAKDEEELINLMQAVYYHVSDLKFMDDKDIFIPSSSEYNLTDIKKFIKLLLAKNGQM